MTRKRTVFEKGSGFKVGSTGEFDIKGFKPPDPTKGTPAEPAVPGILSSPPANRWTLHTVGGTLSFTATAYGKVTGGTPAVVATEIEGREPATSMGDKTGLAASLEIIVSGRVDGRVVQPEVHALFKAAEAGRLVRVYGPFDRPGVQGRVWALGEPTFTDVKGDAAGDTTHAMLTVPLTGWSVADRISIGQNPDVEKKVRDQKRLKASQGRAQGRTEALGFWKG